jgi:hypothetical protein
MTCQTTVLLGVYALGAANASERLLVETHLPDCAECRAELGRLAPLPGLLARLPAELVAANGTARGTLGAPADAPAAALPVTGARPGPFASRPRGARIRSVRPRWAVALAAAAAAAGLAFGLVLAPAAGAPPAAGRHAIVLSGASRLTHVRATVALTATSWGTSIQLRASGIPENVPCRLIVHSRSGATEVAGVWDAWGTGPVTIPASAGLRPSDIADLQVRTVTRTLVTIPAGRR